jgi:hypothetical protein
LHSCVSCACFALLTPGMRQCLSQARRPVVSMALGTQRGGE